MSPASYNVKVGLAILCPITSQVKSYPFEVAIPLGLKVGGMMLSDQVKRLDWRVQKVDFIHKVYGRSHRQARDPFLERGLTGLFER